MMVLQHNYFVGELHTKLCIGFCLKYECSNSAVNYHCIRLLRYLIPKNTITDLVGYQVKCVVLT